MLLHERTCYLVFPISSHHSPSSVHPARCILNSHTNPAPTHVRVGVGVVTVDCNSSPSELAQNILHTKKWRSPAVVVIIIMQPIVFYCYDTTAATCVRQLAALASTDNLNTRACYRGGGGTASRQGSHISAVFDLDAS